MQSFSILRHFQRTSNKQAAKSVYRNTVLNKQTQDLHRNPIMILKKHHVDSKILLQFQLQLFTSPFFCVWRAPWVSPCKKFRINTFQETKNTLTHNKTKMPDEINTDLFLRYLIFPVEKCKEMQSTWLASNKYSNKYYASSMKKRNFLFTDSDLQHKTKKPFGLPGLVECQGFIDFHTKAKENFRKRKAWDTNNWMGNTVANQNGTLL